LGVGQSAGIPHAAEDRILIRGSWGTEIVDELAPLEEDSVVWKHRYSGFYQTELDQLLKQAGIKYLVVTGCTTSVCVESTIRDAFFRDYLCVLLTDCTSEPLGLNTPRSNHDASILLVELMFGWTSTSQLFVSATSASR
jgi:ureidoacrylate peracid hydrolase